MSNISSPSVLSNPAAYQCALCKAHCIVDDCAPETPICQACLKGEAEYEAFRLVKGFAALCRGEAPFDALLPAERAQTIRKCLRCNLDARAARIVSSVQFTAPTATMEYSSTYEPTREEINALLDRENDEAIGAAMDADRWELQH